MAVKDIVRQLTLYQPHTHQSPQKVRGAPLCLSIKESSWLAYAGWLKWL